MARSSSRAARSPSRTCDVRAEALPLLDLRRLGVDGSHITLSAGEVGEPRALYFTIERYGRTLGECGEGRGRRLVVNGRTVYVAKGIAWRCLRAPSGHNVVVKVHGTGQTLKVLGAVAASAQRLQIP